MPFPHWGGLLRTSRSLPIGRAGLGESMLGSASARPPGLQAGGHFLPRATSGGAPRACWAWHLSAGLGALFTTSHRCGDEPGGEGRAGAGCWKSEALGSACLMNERGANRDTEILIRGSLWGGVIIQFSLAAWRPVSTLAGWGAPQLSAEALGGAAADVPFPLCGETEALQSSACTRGGRF